MPIESIARAAAGESGRVSPGTLSGTKATASPRTTNRTATERLATAFHGKSFSSAIRAAIKTIHPMLITPRAKSAAIRPQQQPTHQPPCSTPMRSAPIRPARQCMSTNVIGFRQCRRQTSLSGVSW